MPIPIHKQALIERILAELTCIPGVQAVVLGGSHARGVARPDSDLDIGIYYREAAPFAIADIQQAAARVSENAGQEVTGFYGWGAWVNGGGWLNTRDGKVDFLYRNLDQVERTIAESQQGISHHDYDQQPAYGFYSVMYLAETEICLPLYDPQGQVAQLKAQVAVYPPLLKKQMLAGALWMAEFSLANADSFAAAGNGYSLIGTLTRTAALLTQALFALNETYYLSEKTAMQDIVNFPLRPSNYPERLLAILSRTGSISAELQASNQAMRGLWAEVKALADT
jgi:predicted nucleotidyltransferase